MYDPHQVIFFICEGETERAYLQQWNLLFVERNKPYRFNALVAGGCQERLVIRSYRQRRWKKGEKVYMILDRDRYPAGSEKLEKLAPVLWSRQNFEDFLSLHLPFDLAAEWCATCIRRGHFQTPMCAEAYFPLFQELFQRAYPSFQKGQMPNGFVCDETLLNLQRNYTDTRLHATHGLADYLLREIFPLLGFPEASQLESTRV